MTTIRPFQGKWSLQERADFLLHLGSCLQKGFPLNEALILQQAEGRAGVKKRIDQLIEQLQDGQPLSIAFQDNGFTHEVTSFIHFSSHTGSLEKGLIEAGHFLHFKWSRKKKIEGLLRYPLFLFWLLSIMGFIILHNILPNFKTLYESMSLSLPYMSRILIRFSELLPHIFVSLVLIILMVGIGSYLTYRLIPYEKRLLFLIKLPFVSYLTKLSLTSSFTTHFGALLKIGMPVNIALQIMADQPFHPFLKTEAFSLKQQLQKGLSLSKILHSRPFYTKDLATVVRNGAESGRLGEVLVDYSSILFKKLEDKLTRSILLIQPAFFLLLGGFLLVMFLSILLPMFDMMKGL